MTFNRSRVQILLCVLCFFVAASALAADALPRVSSVTLMIHGLNQNPDTMKSYEEVLRSLGSQVFLVRLTGHQGGDLDAFRKVTADQWWEDALKGFRSAKESADSKKVPLYFMGYSLGALLGELLENDPSVRASFDRMILVAPAIKTRWYLHGLEYLRFLGSSLVVRSANVKEYRVHPGTPLAAYWASRELQKRLTEMNAKLNDRPQLMILSEGDELVDNGEVIQWVRSSGLKNSAWITVNNSASALPGVRHHLIVDEKTASQPVWQTIQREIVRFIGRH